MSDIKLPEGYSPISPDSDLGKTMEKLKNINPQHFSMPQYDFSYISKQVEKQNREMEAIWDGIAEERERKEAAEEAYRQETIRSLNAIEQNTANLYTLVDLISKSNEQQHHNNAFGGQPNVGVISNMVMAVMLSGSFIVGMLFIKINRRIGFRNNFKKVDDSCILVKVFKFRQNIGRFSRHSDCKIELCPA